MFNNHYVDSDGDEYSDDSDEDDYEDDEFDESQQFTDANDSY